MTSKYLDDTANQRYIYVVKVLYEIPDWCIIEDITVEAPVQQYWIAHHCGDETITEIEKWSHSGVFQLKHYGNHCYNCNTQLPTDILVWFTLLI